MSYGLIVGQLPTGRLKGESYNTWLVVGVLFTLLFGCFSLLFVRKAPGSKGEGSSNESSMFCNDCTSIWGESCTIVIVRIINKEIPKGAPRFGANRCLGSCAGAL